MQARQIEFDMKGVGRELKERLLAVPIYQRSYSWTDEEVIEFWADIHAAFKKNASEYFLGTVVLTKQGKPPRDTIIDGQQRLATASILLAAIRDEYQQRGDTVRAGIVQHDYLSTADLASAVEVSRLQLNSEDAHFFSERIINGKPAPEPSKQSHNLILGAHTFLRAQVSGLAKDAGKDWATRLFGLVEFISGNLEVVTLEVPTEADAFLIFETLNDRGADLTIADLLKNYLFGHAGASLDTVRDTWMQVLGALEIAAENELFTTFLRHYWSSKHGAARERELYAGIKQRITTEPQVVEFVNDLQSAATIYAALLNSDHDYWDTMGGTAKENLETLIRLDLEQNRPLLLAALQHFTEGEKRKLLRAVVGWSVRGLITGGIGGGTFERYYCQAAVKVRKGEIKTVAELLTEISAIVPADPEFKAAFAIAQVSKANLARYYLIALEKGKKGEDEPELVPNSNEDQVNLEHVLPKKPSDKDWGKNFNADERKLFIYRLGNLSLLQKGPNGRIGNKPFSAKQPILKKSAFKLTSEIGGEADWTKDAITARQERLSKLAAKVWPR